MSMAAAVSIELTGDERAQLEAWARRRTSAQALAQRSRVVLLAADGLNNTEIAQRLGVHRPMVRKWRSRFAEHRLDGLTDEPRPGRPRTVTDAQVEEVIVKTLESTPRDATHWSTRSMAREVTALTADSNAVGPRRPALSHRGKRSSAAAAPAHSRNGCSGAAQISQRANRESRLRLSLRMDSESATAGEAEGARLLLSRRKQYSTGGSVAGFIWLSDPYPSRMLLSGDSGSDGSLLPHRR
jgi:transposase